MAVDDCDLAVFGMALQLFNDGSSLDTSAGSEPGTAFTVRADPPLVQGSCRKYMGRTLVSCFPNGRQDRQGYTITHCGETVSQNAPSLALQLEFSKEAREQEKAILTLSMIVGEEETWELENLTSQLDEHKRPRTRNTVVFPIPSSSYSPEESLVLVSYLRLLTKKLIKVKTEFSKSKCKFEDYDFI